MHFKLCQTWIAELPHTIVPCATWAYMLETVRYAVRRLQKISNCTCECNYYYHLLDKIITFLAICEVPWRTGCEGQHSSHSRWEWPPSCHRCPCRSWLCADPQKVLMRTGVAPPWCCQSVQEPETPHPENQRTRWKKWTELEKTHPMIQYTWLWYEKKTIHIPYWNSINSSPYLLIYPMVWLTVRAPL